MKASLCRARETRKEETGTSVRGTRGRKMAASHKCDEEKNEGRKKEERNKKGEERERMREKKKEKAPITGRYRRSLKTQKTENQPHYFYLPPSLCLPLPRAPISRNSSWSLVPVHALTRSHPYPPRSLLSLLLSLSLSYHTLPRSSLHLFLSPSLLNRSDQIVVRNRRISGPQTFSLLRHEEEKGTRRTGERGRRRRRREEGEEGETREAKESKVDEPSIKSILLPHGEARKERKVLANVEEEGRGGEGTLLPEEASLGIGRGRRGRGRKREREREKRTAPSRLTGLVPAESRGSI